MVAIKKALKIHCNPKFNISLIFIVVFYYKTEAYL